MSHDINDYNLIYLSEVAHTGDATFEIRTIECPDRTMLSISVVNFHYGNTFTPVDWQGPQPNTIEEIGNYDWVDQDGLPGVIVDGLPRRLID